MIRLSSANLSAMITHAQETFPEECGGLLLGTVSELSGETLLNVAEILRLDNVRLESRHNRIEIHPLHYAKAERYAMQKNLGIWGFYHSHPHAEPIPSEFDRQHFPFVNWWYPIVSIKGSSEVSVRCWKLSATRDSFSEELIDALPVLSG
jgi:proteasome lid subunit RPN8/RPN11